MFDLFAALDASDEQLDFPILYGSAKQGWMAVKPEGPQDSMAPLFDLVVSACAAARHRRRPLPHAGDDDRGQSVPRPRADRPHPLRRRQGRTRPSRRWRATARLIEQGRISKVLAFRGLERQADRGRPGRRHRRHRRPAAPRPSPTRSAIRRCERADRRPAHRSADLDHDLPHQ